METVFTEDDQVWFEGLKNVTGVNDDFPFPLGYPIVPTVDALIEKGIRQIDSIRQLTQGDVLELLARETVELAEKAGFPFPETSMLQRDFLEIDKRKAKLAQLRASGDIEALTEYEHECMNAVLVSGYGYECSPQIRNLSIPDVVVSKKRDCGGIFIQISHWLSELQLEHYGGEVLEDILGTEGHQTFIVRDSCGKIFLLDPALHLALTEITDDLFDRDLLSSSLDAMVREEINSFQLQTKNTEDAYKRPIHPSMIVRQIRVSLRDILLNWTYRNGPHDQEAVSRRYHLLADTLFPAGGIPYEIRLRVFYQLIREGKIKDAENMTRQIFTRNPEGLITLAHITTDLMDSGLYQAAHTALRSYVIKSTMIVRYLYAAILHRENTDCAPGKRITPLTLRFEEIALRLKDRFELLHVLFEHIIKYLQMPSTPTDDKLSKEEKEFLIWVNLETQHILFCYRDLRNEFMNLNRLIEMLKTYRSLGDDFLENLNKITLTTLHGISEDLEKLSGVYLKASQ